MTKIPIRLNLPSLKNKKEGTLYQVANIGHFRKKSGSNPSTSVKVYLQERINSKLVPNSMKIEWINVQQAKFLELGSLWKPDGSLSNERVFVDSIEFKIPENSFSAAPLKDILPNFKYVDKLFDKELWPIAREGIFFKIYHNKTTTVLIPYFELMRSSYYQSNMVVDYLFKHITSNLHINNICTVVDNPTVENDLTASIAFNSNRLNKTDMAIFAEMKLTSVYHSSALYSHNEVLAAIESNTLSNGKAEQGYPSGRFNPGKEILLHARGLSVLNNKYFFVTSLDYIQGLFSFNHLDYTTVVDTRKGVNVNNSEVKNVNGYPHKVGQYDTQRPPTQNSDIEATSNAMDFESENNMPLAFSLPDMQHEPKIDQHRNYHTHKNKYFQELIETFTTEKGGNGKNAFGQKEKGSREAVERDSYQEFLKILQSFHREQDFSINVLTENNSFGKYGKDISIFPYWKEGKTFYLYDGNPRKVGVIQIVYKNSFFYFLKILEAGQRSGFMYKTNHAKFTSIDFNNFVLSKVADCYGNWTEASHFFSDQEFSGEYENRQLHNQGIRLIIHAKNQQNANIVQDCKKLMNKSLKYN